MSQDFEAIIEELTEKNPQYHEDAYEFVMEALHFTQKKFKSVAHVSGESQLLRIPGCAVGVGGKEAGAISHGDALPAGCIHGESPL